jgi:hypothetical protein
VKKFIVTILALIYITTSTGATVHLHYCMGQLADWGLGSDKSKTCSSCGMGENDQKKHDCCKDEHKFLKNENDQKYAEASLQLAQLLAIALPPSCFEIQPPLFSSLTRGNPMSHAPPRPPSVAVYIRNCVFLI